MKISHEQLRNVIRQVLLETYMIENNYILKENVTNERAQKLFNQIVEKGFEVVDLKNSLEDIKVIKKIQKAKGGLKLAKEKYDKVMEVVKVIQKIVDLKDKSKEEINLIILKEIEKSGLIDNALDKGEKALNQFFFTLAFSALPAGGALATKVIRMLSSAASSAIRDYVEEKVDEALALVFLKNTLNKIKPGFYEMLFKSDVASQYSTKKPISEYSDIVWKV